MPGPPHQAQAVRGVSPQGRGHKAEAKAPPEPFRDEQDRHGTRGNLELQVTLSFISKRVTEWPYLPPKYPFLNPGRRPTCPT